MRILGTLNNASLQVTNREQRGNKMASVKKADIPEIAAFMSDFWEFIKSVWGVEDSDEYWDYVHFKAEELYKKHPNAFAKTMILAFCDYLNEVYQKQKDGTGQGGNRSNEHTK